MSDSPPQNLFALDNVFDFIELFECDYRCVELLEKIRWRNGFVCPKCKGSKGYRVPEYRLMQCANCRHQTSATSGTIFHKSHVALRKWFVAIMLLLSDKSGVSAQRLHLIIGVSYKTALSMLKKLRALMGIQNQESLGDNDFVYLLSLLKANEKYPVKGRFAFSRCQDLRGVDVAPDSGSGGAEESLPVTSLRIEDPALSLTETNEQEFASHRPSKSELMSVAGAVALTRHFFLGTFHRASSKYLQLYFDEFVYRYKESNVLALIVKFLVGACRTNTKEIFEYLDFVVNRKGFSGCSIPGKGIVCEEVMDYLAFSLRS